VAGPASARSGERVAFTLEARPESVGEARRRLAALSAPFLDAVQRDHLKLVISEVVTNAIRHGASDAVVTVAVTPKEEFLCVQVTDAGGGLAPKPQALASDEDGGFGLFLVERLTRRWGVTRENDHTRVWFELDYCAT
jgi:serine/threonine-protein kinase RsbW